MPWSILAGAVVSAFAIELPTPVGKTIGLLADAASPVALFTIGAVLARSQIMAEQDAAHAVPWDEVVPVALVKLFLHPLLVLLVGVSAISLGVPLGKDALTVLVLLAALPSASNVSLLGRTLRRRQRPHRPHHSGLHRRGVLYVFGGGGGDGGAGLRVFLASGPRGYCVNSY